MEVGIGAVDFYRFVPNDGLQSQLRFPVEFDEGRFVLGVYEPKGMDTEAFHKSTGARDCPVGHHPHDHMHAFGRETDEVPEVVMGGLRLRKSRVWLLLDRVDHVRKLDRILNKEDRNIVAHNVPITLPRVKLYSK